MANSRRAVTGEEKVAILRRHLVDKVAVSDVCDEYGLNPTAFYRWRKVLFENGAAAFEQRGGVRERNIERKVEALSLKLGHKDEVIAEIMESHVALKKVLGRSEVVLGRAASERCGG